jgi:4-carboxymuconolactone decarboxylase
MTGADESANGHSAEGSAFARGMDVRTRVLGREHVARQKAASEQDVTTLQRFVTEFGWGTVWSREGLPLPTRSLITVSMLIALNRPEELRVHLRGAVNNGCTREEITETVLHAVLYCGFPAALDAMRLVDELDFEA